MQNLTRETLRQVRSQIAADSGLLNNRMTPQPGPEAATGFSALFAAAAHALTGAAREPYLFSLEYIFEGYLLHYGRSRVLLPADTGFSLLAGDYMYAQGLSRISQLGDAVPIRLLAGLVSLCSFIECEKIEAVLALEAWSATSLSLAAHALDPGGAGGMAEELMDPARDFPRTVERLPALREQLMTSCQKAAGAPLKPLVDDIYSSFIPVFAR